jgi:hypothetical protein
MGNGDNWLGNTTFLMSQTKPTIQQILPTNFERGLRTWPPTRLAETRAGARWRVPLSNCPDKDHPARHCN